MKILNLYAGIGGNRKLWGNEHKITAVENNQEIAKIYQDFLPKDKVIVTDAHQYLLDHHKSLTLSGVVHHVQAIQEQGFGVGETKNQYTLI